MMYARNLHRWVWCLVVGHRRKFSTYPRMTCIRCGSLPPKRGVIAERDQLQSEVIKLVKELADARANVARWRKHASEIGYGPDDIAEIEMVGVFDTTEAE